MTFSLCRPGTISLLLAANFLLCLPRTALAEPVTTDSAAAAPICEAAESEDYLTKASGQLLRGVANLCFCWVELFNQPVVARREGRSIVGGFFVGIGHTVLRGAKGLGEVVIFPAPRIGHAQSYPTLADDCALGVVGLEAR